MFLFGERNKTSKKEKNNKLDDYSISSNIYQNFQNIKEIYSYPENQDFIIRQIYISCIKREAMICYLDGLIDQEILEKQVIQPLQQNIQDGIVDILTDLSKKVIQSKSIKITRKMQDVVRFINSGQGVLVIDGIDQAIILAITSYSQRTVERPQNEHVITGPQEAFIENGQTNRSLIRKQLRTEHLMSENVTVGTETHSEISIMYMKNIVDPDLLKDVKNRINEIDKDNVQDIGLLEQHIEERPFSLVPSVLLTERPDRVVSFLLEGHIALVHTNSPNVLILPVTFWGLFHTSEDSYLRLMYGMFIRILRLLAVIIALLISPFYIALANYHHEMIPTDLLFAISGTRELVPLPAIVELFAMELAFEIIREAGLRVPSPMGQMIGIVGALILGQAAVQANVVSPIMIIVISLGGVASFAIPSNSLGYMIRISKFIYILFAGTLGLMGLAFIIVLFLTYLLSYKSFGVPFFAPLAPNYKGSHDMIYRPPVWLEWLRPLHMNPKDKQRAKKPKGNNRQ